LYVVDTDVSIEYMKGNHSAIELLESLDDLHLTTITIAELFFGAYNSQGHSDYFGYGRIDAEAVVRAA